MIKVMGYTVKRDSRGYKMHHPNKRVTYYGSLHGVCKALMSCVGSKGKSVEGVINKLEECTRRIERATKEMDDTRRKVLSFEAEVDNGK